jgi:NADPH-dependent glutamate synthase beta subunit-like oxidoreductase
MNDALKKLYEKHYKELRAHCRKEHVAHPLLIQVDERYETADIRVMIVGQETDGWAGSLVKNTKSVDELQRIYYEYLHHSRDKNRRPFWNRKNFKYFQEKIPLLFPDKKVGFIWNNASKIGKTTRGKPGTYIQKLERRFFDVFEEEFKILQPDIVIFTIGDRRIPMHHEPINSVKKTPVSIVRLPNYPETLAIRTYHPNARIKGGKKRFKKEILDLIGSNPLQRT